MLVGGLNPSEKYQSIGMIIPNIWKNKKCSSHHQPGCYLERSFQAWTSWIKPKSRFLAQGSDVYTPSQACSGASDSDFEPAFGWASLVVCPFVAGSWWFPRGTPSHHPLMELLR